MSPNDLVVFTRYGGWIIAAWQGAVDMSNAQQVERQTVRAVSNTDAALTVDLSAVTYLDSAGIRSIINIRSLLAARQQRFAAVVPAGSLLTKTLEVGGLSSLVTIHPSLASAAETG